MAIKYEKIKAGDTLYDCHRTRMGNTTMSRMGTWQVHVYELTGPDHPENKNRGAYVSWNGNRKEWWPEYRLVRLRAKLPNKLRSEG